MTSLYHQRFKTTEERFWEKVRKSDNCWEWKATKYRSGYGQFRLDGVPQGAHRVAWILTNGAISDSSGYHGTCVLHSCDNRACVRPDHLFLGGQKENVRDMHRKGRENKCKGEEHPKAKLCGLDIRLIRELLKTQTQQVVADRFGIGQSQISKIKRRKAWRHVHD